MLALPMSLRRFHMVEKNATQPKKAKEFSGHFLSLFFIGDCFHIGGGGFHRPVKYLRF